MENFYIRFAIGSEINFPEKLLKIISKNFDFDLSQKNLNNVFMLMTSLDGTLSRKVKRGEIFEWKINISENSITSNRFESFLPYIFLSKHLENILYPFQKEGVDWLMNSHNRILADDMGLGKTLQTIYALQKLYFEEKLNIVVIFCPKSLLFNWEIELKKWSPLLQVRSFRDDLSGNKNFILQHLKGYNVHLISYSEANKFCKIVKDEDLKVDLLIADEAHKLRNDSSKLNRLIESINRNKTWLLTGTPLERDTKDIKNILTLLEPKKAKAFSEAEDIILRSNLKQNSLRRMKSQVLNELPKSSKKTIMLEMTEEQDQLYHQTLKLMGSAKGKDRISFITRLVQVAAGDTIIDSCKYNRAIEIIQNCIENNEKVIVFSGYNNVLKTFQKKLNSYKIKNLIYTGELDAQARDNNLQKFKTEKDSYVLNINANVGSEGLTLTEANNVIFLNEWWNPSSNRQAEDRINRIGQKNHTFFHILRSFKTIDENIGMILDNKTDIEKNFTEQLLSSFIK